MFFNAKKMTVIFSAVIFFAAFDRLLKVLAAAGAQYELVGQIFRFDFTANYYIAFSLPVAGARLNAIIFLIIILLIYFLIISWKSGASAGAFGLLAVILGAASNLYDRLKYGFVIDYWDLKYFTVFNLADALIVAGSLLLFVVLYKKQAD